MQRASKDIGRSVASGLILAAIIFAVGEFAGQGAMEILGRFILAFLPVWVGAAGGGLIIWMVLSVYRVTHGRDDEFQKWLLAQQRCIDETFANQFSKMAADTETIRSVNASAMNGFHEVFERRLSAVETRFRGLVKDSNP